MKKRVIAYLHTHWDREWYREKEEFNLRLLEVFDEVLEELSCGNAPCFYFDGQTSALIDYLKFRPEKLSIVEKLIKDKKLSIGPFFVSSDTFLANLRCMVKNLEKGLKYSKQLGENDFIAYLCDTFGHSRGIFEIIKNFNIKNALVWRGIPAVKSEMNVRETNTARLVYGYFNDTLHQNMSVEKKAQNLEKFIDKIAKYSTNTILLPLGADHLGILKNAKIEIENINKHLKNYKIELALPQKYFELADFKNSKKFDGEFLDNSETYILGGVYSARIYQKIQNAKLLHRLSRVIEPAVTLLGLNYSVNIDYAWELMLKNHAHDSIYGCSTDNVHKAVDMRFQKISEILSGIEKRIARDLNDYEKSPDKIAILNLSNYKNSGLCQIISEHKIKNAQIVGKISGFSDKILYDTTKIPITEDYTTLYKQLVQTKPQEPFSLVSCKPLKAKKLTKITQNTIENSHIKFEIKNGKINVTDKISDKLYKDFINITDTIDGGDSYNYAPKSKPKKLEIIKTKIIENGDIRSILRVYLKNIELDIQLNNVQKFATFNLNIKNKNKNHKLQMVFNLDGLIKQTFAQDNLGIVKRNCDPNYSLFENEPAMRPFELKTNSFPMQNFVFAQNIGILSEGAYEYEIYKNELRIAILRATGVISNPKNPARAIPAGPPIEIPDAQCLKTINLNLGLVFEKNKNKMFAHAEEFLNTKICFVTDKNFDKVLFNAPKNLRFEGFCDDKNAIFCNDKTQSVEFLRVANT